jgi:hypothetical protein
MFSMIFKFVLSAQKQKQNQHTHKTDTLWHQRSEDEMQLREGKSPKRILPSY